MTGASCKNGALLLFLLVGVLAGRPSPAHADPSIEGVRFARPFQFWSGSLGGGAPNRQFQARVAATQFFTERWALDLGYRFGDRSDQGPGTSYMRYQALSSHLSVPVWVGESRASGTIVLSRSDAGYNKVRIRYLEGLMPVRWIVSLVAGQTTTYSSLRFRRDDQADLVLPSIRSTSIDAGIRLFYLRSGGVLCETGKACGSSNHGAATLLVQVHPWDFARVGLDVVTPYLMEGTYGGFGLGLEVARSFPIESNQPAGVTTIIGSCRFRLLELFL